MMPAKRLGAVLAGGRSSRFGSDKADALLHGRSLLAHAVAAMARQCDAVIVVGRISPLAASVPDWPRPDMGPLGGLAAALNHALAEGFAEVLSCSVDSIGLPANLAERLAPAPACVASQPVIGLWPAASAQVLQDVLKASGRHSMRAFAERIGARAVVLDRAPANINTPDDLRQVELGSPNHKGD